MLLSSMKDMGRFGLGCERLRGSVLPLASPPVASNWLDLEQFAARLGFAGSLVHFEPCEVAAGANSPHVVLMPASLQATPRFLESKGHSQVSMLESSLHGLEQPAAKTIEYAVID